MRGVQGRRKNGCLVYVAVILFDRRVYWTRAEERLRLSKGDGEVDIAILRCYPLWSAGPIGKMTTRYSFGHLCRYCASVEGHVLFGTLFTDGFWRDWPFDEVLCWKSVEDMDCLNERLETGSRVRVGKRNVFVFSDGVSDEEIDSDAS